MQKFLIAAARRSTVRSPAGFGPNAMRRSVGHNSTLLRWSPLNKAAVSAANVSVMRYHGHSHGDGTVCHHDHGHSHGNGEMCYHDHGHGHSHGNGEMCHHDHGHGHSHGGFVPPEVDPKKIVPEDHPLMVAAREGNAELIRKLFTEAKAAGTPLDANCYQHYRITPLHEAADLGHTEACKALLENGAELDGQMQDGQTPLHVAAFNGHAETVSALLELHADYDVRNELEYAPLHSAIAKGHLEAMKALLSAGADVDATCMDGLSCLQLAVLFASTPNPSPISRNAPAGTNQTEVSAEEYFNVVKFLISFGANIGAQDDVRRTVLHTAAERNSTAIVKMLVDLVKTHPDPSILAALVNSQTVEGVTAIHIAAAHNNLEMTKALVEAGGDPSIQADQHTTPLHTAAGKGSIDVLKYLLEVRKAASGDAWPAPIVAGPEATAIHFAAQEGHIEAVEALLNEGAEVEATIGSGDTPLHLAASGGHLNVVRLLLSKGANISALNSDGIAPIHTAASSNSEETVKALAEAGANLEAVTAAGWTPLHIAASNGADQSVWFLIRSIEEAKGAEEAKASVNTTIGEAKWTALHLAAQGNHPLTAEALLESGADANATGANGLCPLHFAAQFYEINTVALLLKKGANPSAADANGRTPLHVAAMFEHPAITKMLLEVKADTSARVKGTDGDSYTALHIAASAGHKHNVELLVKEGGADVNIRSHPGEKTPLHVGALATDLPVVLKLLSLGADPTLKNAEGKVAAELTADEQIIAALNKK